MRDSFYMLFADKHYDEPDDELEEWGMDFDRLVGTYATRDAAVEAARKVDSRNMELGHVVNGKLRVLWRWEAGVEAWIAWSIERH